MSNEATVPAGPDREATRPVGRDREMAPTAGPEGERLVMFLERDQLVFDKARPVPRARLTRRATLALWALRVFVLILSAIVIYTFVAQLRG